MIGLDKFMLMGTVQRTEIVMQSIRETKEAVDVYMSVMTYRRGTHEYRVGVFLPELVEAAKALRPGQRRSSAGGSSAARTANSTTSGSTRNTFTR